MDGISNYFNDWTTVEPKCPGCGIVLDYGTNTEYSDVEQAHVCLKCKTILK